MRRARPLAALALGLAIGVVATSAIGPDAPMLPAARPARSVEVSPPPRAPAGVLLIWTPGGLPAGFTDQLRGRTPLSNVTVVLGDTVQLASSADADGRVVDHPPAARTIPLDAIAVDCSTWKTVMPIEEATAVCGLTGNEVLLGTTSARLRRLTPGASITVANGDVLLVAGIVDDATVGAAELVLRRADAAAAGVDTERYALATYTGDRAAAEASIRATTGTALRVRGPGETPWLRHGDAVLPPSLLKDVFGEFAARDAGGGRLDIDPAWTAANLETVALPVLGQTTCHRALVPALRGALTELVDRGLLTSLDRRAAGCWNPRTIVGTTQPSRHAWGAAVDLVPLPPDPEVIAVMERWGFTWGGRWVEPDPVHFEYLRPPASGTRHRNSS